MNSHSTVPLLVGVVEKCCHSRLSPFKKSSVPKWSFVYSFWKVAIMFKRSVNTTEPTIIWAQSNLIIICLYIWGHPVIPTSYRFDSTHYFQKIWTSKKWKRLCLSLSVERNVWFLSFFHSFSFQRCALRRCKSCQSKNYSPPVIIPGVFANFAFE